MFEYGKCAGSSRPRLLTGAKTTKTFCAGSYHEIAVEIYTWNGYTNVNSMKNVHKIGLHRIYIDISSIQSFLGR